MSFVLLTAFTLSVPQLVLGKWDYDEESNSSHWAAVWPECGGVRQSPIDVIFNTTDTCDDELVLHYESVPQHFAIRNTGHTLQAIAFEIDHAGGSEISGLEIMHHTNDTAMRLKNSFYNTYKDRVNKEYCFDSMHWHWGETNEYGSEHTLNGQFYPLELHLVHYSCDYYRVGDAIKAYTDSKEKENPNDDVNMLAVIGVVFEIGEPNPVFDRILTDDVVNAIRYFDESPAMENFIELYYTEFDINDLLPKNRSMVAYEGSLTTPPCFETVRWHVLKQPMTVSLEQMLRFRMILESTDLDDEMAPNWRPVQPVYNRTLFECEWQVEDQVVLIKDDGDEYIGEGSEEDHDHDHGEEDHDIMHEMEGSMENLMWIGIGVAFIVICYLTYIIHCKEQSRGGHGNVSEMEDSESDNLVPDVSTQDI